MREKKDKIRAIIGTIIFHLLLLIALVFMALITPLPLPEEEGVEVNLGFSNVGSGHQQKTKPMEQVKPPPPSPKVETPEQPDDEIIQTDEEEAPAIIEKPKEKPKKEIEKEKPEEPKKIEEQAVEEQKPEEIVEEKPEPKPEPVIDQRLIYTGKKNQTGDSQEGNDQVAGDKGKVTGDPNSNGYDGLGGKGNGVSYSLGGREAKSLPKPAYNSDDQGKVVISIWVDKMGNVTRAEVMQKGTVVTDIKLRNMARQAAMKAKFSVDREAAEVQKGTITYNFIKL
jgi:TonB family protein